MIRNLVRCASIILLFAATPALAQYTPIFPFTYIMPNGIEFTTAPSGDPVAAFTANRASTGVEVDCAAKGLALAGVVNDRYFLPIRASLVKVQLAQQASDVQGAKAAATEAASTWNELWNSQVLNAIAYFLDLTGENQDIATFTTDYFNYVVGLKGSVDEAQRVPAQIEGFIRNNEAGTALFNAAASFEGVPYTQLTCDQLISRAADKAGVQITTAPGGPTPTKSWFAHGMGPEFPQIAGGSDGIPLSQLVNEETSNLINLPIGAVIVTDGGTDPQGHAALFIGEVTVNNDKQIVLYDANNYTSIQLAVDGGTTQDDANDVMLNFPGHQSGEHVTHLQWGDSHLVKVFQPIGNHIPPAFDAEPYFEIRLGTVTLPPGTPAPKYLNFQSPVDLTQPVPCGRKNPGVALPFQVPPCGQPPIQLPH